MPEHFLNPPSYTGRGCPAAVLRIWVSPGSDLAPVELCGEKPFADSWHYLSQEQAMRVSFTTTDKTIGAGVSHNYVDVVDVNV